MMPFQEFVAVLRRDLDAAIAGLAKPIVEGGAESFDEYLRWASQILGIRKAREILDDLVKRSNEGSV